MYLAGQPVNVKPEYAHRVQHFRAEFAAFLPCSLLHQALQTEDLLIRVGNYRNVSVADNAAELRVAVAGRFTGMYLIAAVHLKADLVALFDEVYLPALLRAVEVECALSVLLLILTGFLSAIVFQVTAKDEVQ